MQTEALALKTVRISSVHLPFIKLQRGIKTINITAISITILSPFYYMTAGVCIHLTTFFFVSITYCVSIVTFYT